MALEAQNRPVGGEPVLSASTTTITQNPDNARRAALARLGEIEREIGWEAAVAQWIADSCKVASDAAPLWRHPRQVEVEERRKLDHEPCTRRCGLCSRCIHAAAWRRRGRRPFLGVERERRLSAGDRI